MAALLLWIGSSVEIQDMAINDLYLKTPQNVKE